MDNNNRPPVIDAGEVEEQDAELLDLRKIMAGEISRYKQLRPAKAYSMLGFQWLMLAALISAAILSGIWWVYALVIPLIAGRMHAVGVIGHDGAHFRLSSNRTANEWVADLFCMLPLTFALSRWRYDHLLHHKYINTDKDPFQEDVKTFTDWHWPKPKTKAMQSVVSDIAGLGVKSVFAPGVRWNPFSKGILPLTRVEKWRAYAFFALLAIILTITGGWFYYLLLWVVPMLTFLVFYMRWRTIAEHLGMDASMDINGTRHTDADWLARLTIAPCGINYHIAHHIFPAVPFYNLPALHKRLLQEPIYRDKGYFKPSYFGRGGVFAEVVSRA